MDSTEFMLGDLVCWNESNVSNIVVYGIITDKQGYDRKFGSSIISTPRYTIVSPVLTMSFFEDSHFARKLKVVSRND